MSETRVVKASLVREGDRIAWCDRVFTVTEHTAKKYLTKRYSIWFTGFDNHGQEHRLSWFNDEDVLLLGPDGNAEKFK